MADAALPYEEPGVVTILVQASFLLALNVVNSILDNVFYCGLVGQVLIGMAWGTPGAKMLSHHVEQVITQLGYLGLILIVFEGGLSTSAKSIQTTLLLSICVALTGIILPMAFSFSLLALAEASNLQAFAAGSALCSTSLGTTFSILKTTGLTNSRLGTVLTSAAMLDDVVGLIMVQVISNLGSGNESIQATTVIRPVFVSLGFAIVLPLACRLLAKPALNYYCNNRAETWLLTKVDGVLSRSSIYCLLSTALLMGLVCAASYAGTSALFAAYLAGASIAYLDESVAQNQAATPRESGREATTMHQQSPVKVSKRSRGTMAAPEDIDPDVVAATSSRKAHEDLTSPASSTRLPTPPPEGGTDRDDDKAVPTTSSPASEDESRSLNMYNTYHGAAVERILKPFFFASIGFSIPITRMFQGSIVWRGLVYSVLMAIGKLFCGAWLIRFVKASATAPNTGNEQERKKSSSKPLPRPKSLYPASLLGCAMVARGEIGFLISALAASNGIFSTSGTSSAANLESDIYLIVTWAILLCTIVGPLALGILARRVKRLQAERMKSGSAEGEDPLGIWGVG
ncbi:hypothetical protein A1O1_09256 [Capronia coronata CBS 617.96]|uniref:Cation/H+ exchanger transmembrane domain-containing protein n=1 Tax=Capronia coronata CBS 617.96 TaxID=1182541 RepID=W9Y918_9EURO|nr:uncharacterized protein A1O1_09256 [Capronia coronata CBS 617.96]EXJ78854.1 hypothetical protein A1O1_09256 [Capronia coronata CBS 617.96]